MNEKNILSFKNYVSSKFGEDKIIKEKGMSQNEIEELINSAEEIAQDIQQDPKRKKEDKFDYSDFKKVIEPKAIPQVVKVMKNMLKAAGERYVMVLTARRYYKPIKEFLRTIGLNVKVIALASGDPWDKRDWIGRQIEKNKFDDIVFFDDSRKNIKAVDMLKDKHPKVKLITRHIKYSPHYREKGKK